MIEEVQPLDFNVILHVGNETSMTNEVFKLDRICGSLDGWDSVVASSKKLFYISYCIIKETSFIFLSI